MGSQLARPRRSDRLAAGLREGEPELPNRSLKERYERVTEGEMIGDGPSAGRVLGLVPARAGSLGLPGKNTRVIAGRPMVAWTLQACLDATVLDRVVVSTDDDAVAAVASDFGMTPPFRRPAHLSGPAASVVDAVEHALTTIGGQWDYVVLLQPTSPLRLGADIDAAVRLCHETGAPSVIAVSPVLKPQTFYGRVGQQGVFRADSPAPDEPVVINGSIYVGRPESLLARRSFQGPGTLAHIMPPERGWDVDTAFDFAVCEALWPHVRGTHAAPLDSLRR